jgi:hypothetical protein
MRLPPPNRRFSTLAVMGALALMIAVFGWGLQYKLSLYQRAANHSGSVSQAKLLSQKERPAASNSLDPAGPLDFDRPILVSEPTFLAAVILLSAFAALLLWFRVDAVLRYSSHQRLAASNFFAFRPPPSFLL